MGNEAMGLLSACASRGWRIACAESVTGGMLANAFVSIPGSSRVFAGSLVVYDIYEKERILGVDEEILRLKGAVEEEVALQMAQGAGRVFGNSSKTLLISSTGVAGPQTDGFKKVGTVCCAIIAPGLEPALKTFGFSGGRQQIRKDATSQILKLALARLSR